MIASSHSKATINVIPDGGADDLLREIAERNAIAAHDDRALQHVLELAHVAGPVIAVLQLSKKDWLA